MQHMRGVMQHARVPPSREPACRRRDPAIPHPLEELDQARGPNIAYVLAAAACNSGRLYSKRPVDGWCGASRFSE
jgi:hypothetical protein